MVATYLHYEVLGPRADLDTWLGTLQDAGSCHLADALQDLEGEAGVGRPALRAEEMHAGLVRSEAARVLRGVARVLPPAQHLPPPQHPSGTARRPDWGLGPGGVGERELLQLKDEAREIAASLRAVLERGRVCEEEVVRLDAVDRALRLLEGEGATDSRAHVFRVPGGSRRARRLQRSLAKLGADVLRGRGERGPVVVLRDAPPPSGAVEAAADLGADGADVPPDLAELAPGAARLRLADRVAAAGLAEAEARAALTATVAQVGARGRFLLDSLEDAEARADARRCLASTEYVAAARVYVRPEDEPRLRDGLRAAHGDVVVMRPLAVAEDAPSRPRRVAAVPFAAFRGLLPARFGEVSPATVLALVAPLAVGIAWADVVGGLLLMMAGGLLGWRAGAGSPRRDTALLAQIGGFLALVLGVLRGSALGPAGTSWFGGGWGVAPDVLAFLPAAPSPWLAPFAAVLFVLGACALLLAAWGAILTLRAWQCGRRARAGATLRGALQFAVIAGLAAAAAGPAHPLGLLGLLAPAAVLALLGLAGPRRVAVRVGLDLVGILRLVAVAGAALVVFDLVLGGWVDPGLLDVTLGPLALLVAAVAVVADPAHMAMGVPYDLSLGGRRLSRPFEPFERGGRALRAPGSGPGGEVS